MTAVAGMRRLGFAIAALVVLAVGTAGALTFLIPADQVREAVKAEIKAVTGLEPVLRGPSTISLFPSGSVSFSDVVLDGANKDEPPLTTERLKARLRFFPLLTGRVEISDIWLENPRIVVVVAPDGRSNWAPLMASLTRAFGPKSSRDDSASFSEIRISGGTVSIRDETRNLSEELSNMEMSLAWPAISKSFAATGRFTWRNEPVDASISVADFGTALQGDKSGLKVRLAGAPIKFNFDGSMSLRPTLKMEGTLTADSSSLRRAIDWTQRRPLPGGGFGRFTLKAQTNIVGGTIALSGVNLELDGNTAEGVLTFATDGRQTWQGTLAADTLDLTPYVSSVKLLVGNERHWNRQRLELQSLDGVDLDLRFSAGKVTIGGAKLERMAVATNVRDGKLAITIGESRAFGGSIRGSFGLAKKGETAEFKSQLQFSDIDLETGIGELFGIKRLEGKGHLAIALEASGTTVQELANSVNGTAGLTGHDGALTGLDVEQLLRRLERRPLSGGNEFRTGRTPFDRLSMALKLSRGVAEIEDFSVEGPSIRMIVTGTASVPTRDFDLKGVASLLGTANGNTRPTFDLPFVVQGPWDDPIMLPDPQILIRRSGAAAPLLQKLGEGSASEAVKKALERLGIGKASSPTAPVSDAAPAQH